MRRLIGFIGLAALMLCGPLVASAAAADADVTYVITNGGVDVKGEGQVHFVVHGNHDGATVNWSNSGEPAQIPAGNYDVHVTFADGSANKDIWLDNQSFSGKVQKTCRDESASHRSDLSHHQRRRRHQGQRSGAFFPSRSSRRRNGGLVELRRAAADACGKLRCPCDVLRRFRQQGNVARQSKLLRQGPEELWKWA